VGGWTYAQAFHKIMIDPTSRDKLINSCAALLMKYESIFDGFDIDVEYPCPPGTEKCGNNITPSDNDKDRFTELMQGFKNTMKPG
jgi:GH18 family chitinase